MQTITAQQSRSRSTTQSGSDHARHLNRREPRSLDGIWAFGFTESPADEVEYKSMIAVPGCWDATIEYALCRGVGHYRRTIHVREAGRYRLCFEGVVNGAVVEVAGKQVADHFGPHVPFVTHDFDLEAGEHEVVVHVDNRFGQHNTMLLQKCGWYCYGGIHRSVTLEKVPEKRIDQLHVTTLSLNGASAMIRVEGRFAESCSSIRLAIADASGTTCSQQVLDAMDGTLDLTLELDKIIAWTPDNPTLYSATLETPDDVRTVRFGIRTVTCHNRKILLNGQPIELRGINHHDYHPESGHTSDLLRVKRDLDIIKGLGMNFVRTSHYPKDSCFLDLCDEMGLMVWEETPGWQNGPESMMSPLFKKQYLQSVEAMVTAHYNHPSIIMWGFLNEARTEHAELREVFETIVSRFRNLDPHRPLSYATNRLMHNPDQMLDLVDILAPNLYNGWYLGEYGKAFPSTPNAYLEALLAWFESRGLGDKPVVIGEFGAGGIAGYHRLDSRRWSEENQLHLLKEALEAYIGHPKLAGAALWLFADTACCESEEMKRPHSHNSKGLLDPYRNPKMAYHFVKEYLAG